MTNKQATKVLVFLEDHSRKEIIKALSIIELDDTNKAYYSDICKGAREYLLYSLERGQGIVVLALFFMLLLAGILVVWFVVTCITSPDSIKDILDSIKYFLDSLKSLVSGI